MSVHDGGPAFPLGTKTIHHDTYGGGRDVEESGYEPGMTLRDYFAAKALPALIAATCANQHEPACETDIPELQDRIAFDAYEVADAMLRAREPQA